MRHQNLTPWLHLELPPGCASAAMAGVVSQHMVHNDEWSLKRRYMQLEGLQTLGDTVPTRLSAVAR